MRKAYKQFFHGKNLPKTNKGQKPRKWEPNTNIDTYNALNGKFCSRRKFGNDGFPIKDMDVSDDKHATDHIHDYYGEKRSKFSRLPSKKERKELNKAKRKRRFIQ